MSRYELRDRKVIDVVDTEDEDNAISTFRDEEEDAARAFASDLEARHNENKEQSE